MIPAFARPVDGGAFIPCLDACLPSSLDYPSMFPHDDGDDFPPVLSSRTSSLPQGGMHGSISDRRSSVHLVPANGTVIVRD